MRGGIAVLAIGAVALGACSGNKGVAADPNVLPGNYRQEVLDTMRTSKINPAYVIDASISAPALRPSGKEQRYSVCVRATSRETSGAPGEPKEYIAWFWGGHLNQLVPAQPDQCAGAAYAPWPELKNICGGGKCTQ